MATVNKDFRVKHGLIVEGTTGTINGSAILTQASTEFLQDTIGGMVSTNTESGISVSYDDDNGKLDFNVNDPIITIAGDVDGNATMTNLGDTTITVALDTVNTAVGTYGTSTAIPSITVDGKGRVTNVTTNSISTTLGIAGDTGTDNVALGADTLTFEGGTGITSTVSDNKVKVDIDSTVTTNSGIQTLTNKTLTSPKINEDVALTATATELNTLDGITATVSELNVLDGITATVAELNILDGVTSTATELNILDGATLTTTELNYVDGVTSAIQTQLDGKLDESGGTMTGALAMSTNKITGLGTPTDSADAATKGYVDGVAEGLHIHEAARVAVQGNISIATGLENGDTAGGVTLATGNRVLLKDQTNAAENGIYVVQVSGQALRATDFDTATEVDSGDFVFVSEGTYANTGWVQTLKPATIGTDPLQFTQFSGAGTFTAGNGLLLNGTVFEIDDTITATNTYVDTNFVNIADLPGELDDYVLLTQKGAIDGVATLDGTAQVPLNQLENVTDVIDALTTTDIAEGTGLYFTNTRAVDALEAVVPNFTAIEINSIAKQVAAIAYAPTALSGIVAYAFPKADYRSAKFLVKVAYSTHTEVSEVLLTLDSSDNIAITEFAVVSTNGSASTISANISGSNVQLLVTPNNNGSTVTVFGTLLSEDLLLS